MPRFVLEIGTEELPPRFFPPALAQLKEDGERMLDRARLSYSETKVYGTPRRLVFIAEEVAAQQAPNTREERGPATKVAFDADGKPTKAAVGFAARHGLTPDQLVVRETDQGSYVFAVVQDPELPATEALAQVLPDLISGLSFPKSMRWGTGKLRFGRPVRWLLALLDSAVVEFEVEGLRSGRLTRGHPVLADGMHEVRSAGEYEETLKEYKVIVDPDERQCRIEERLQQIAVEQNGTCLHGGRMFDWAVSQYVTKPDEFAIDMATSLVLQTVFLVEWPTCTTGRYDKNFLSLPVPILIEEMRHVQSYFPLAKPWQDGDNDWTLLPFFIAVRDGREQNLDAIVAGWENVLRAKLIDAKFFYEQDLKTALSDQVEKLKGVAFHEKLGSIYEKMERIRAVATELSDQIGLDKKRRGWLDRAAYLCKADLVTEVVQELSDLQGVMGAIYARNEKEPEPEEVSQAIRCHYMPHHADDDAPDTSIGTFLALADKIDTLVAYFSIGIMPSGSTDPYGLRREAIGIIKCLVQPARFLDSPELDRTYGEVSIDKLARKVLEKLRASIEVPVSDDGVVQQVTDFLTQRLDAFLRDKVRYDLVQAALAVGLDPVRMAFERAHALRRLSEKNYFLPTVVTCTRPINISKGFDDDNKDVDEELLEERGEPAEKALWAAYKKVHGKVKDKVLIGQELDDLFGEITEHLVAPINRYFDDVMVMVEDERIRNNRLATCWHIAQLCRRIGDFTKIVQA